MKKILLILSVGGLCVLQLPIYGQAYFRGEQTVIQPLQVMAENFTTVTLPKEVTEDPNANHFDRNNVYTYLQLVRDSWDKTYQLIFQTTFSGKIVFLAYSNSLAAVFNTSNKPLNVFVNCISHINNQFSALQNADAAVKCMIERLNYCVN